jgi:hypothetical protein
MFSWNQIRVVHSLDFGATFSAPITVSTVAINNAAPALAIDRTSSKNRGTVYVSWSGSPTGTYTDVLVSESLDKGVSFSFPRPINTAPARNAGRFQSSPVLAVDNDGQVEDCFYTTPTNTPTSSSVYSYACAMSFNHAATWQTHGVVSAAPSGYDAVTADFLLQNDGFFTAFEQNVNGTTSVFGQSADIH